MRIFLVLICSLALACIAAGAQEPQKQKEAPKKKAAQAGKVAAKPAQAGKPQAGGPAGAGKPTGVGKSAQLKRATNEQKLAQAQVESQKQELQQLKPTGAGKPKGGKSAQVSKVDKVDQNKAQKEQVRLRQKKFEELEPTGAGKPAKAGKATGAGKPAEAATATATGKGAAKGKPFKPQHFNLASKTKPNKAAAPAVNFQQNRRIQGSQNWQGSNYQVFRNYRSEWHDRDWWRHNHSRIVFVFGGPYYWNSGYWFPAWGYDPGAYYAYDGPIYAYNNLPPDQVIANVQAALQQQGYYQGEVDGLLGPLTRDAVANYQRDHGLYTTSTIDRPTLESLGMA
jgi:hypothetical protein